MKQAYLETRIKVQITLC